LPKPKKKKKENKGKLTLKSKTIKNKRLPMENRLLSPYRTPELCIEEELTKSNFKSFYKFVDQLKHRENNHKKINTKKETLSNANSKIIGFPILDDDTIYFKRQLSQIEHVRQKPHQLYPKGTHSKNKINSMNIINMNANVKKSKPMLDYEIISTQPKKPPHEHLKSLSNVIKTVSIANTTNPKLSKNLYIPNIPPMDSNCIIQSHPNPAVSETPTMKHKPKSSSELTSISSLTNLLPPPLPLPLSQNLTYDNITTLPPHQQSSEAHPNITHPNNTHPNITHSTSTNTHTRHSTTTKPHNYTNNYKHKSKYSPTPTTSTTHTHSHIHTNTHNHAILLTDPPTHAFPQQPQHLQFQQQTNHTLLNRLLLHSTNPNPLHPLINSTNLPHSLNKTPNASRANTPFKSNQNISAPNNNKGYRPKTNALYKGTQRVSFRLRSSMRGANVVVFLFESVLGNFIKTNYWADQAPALYFRPGILFFYIFLSFFLF
jgi:hypothetical protein